jgi:hypothetical protein
MFVKEILATMVMAQPNKPDLNLRVPGQEDSTHTWVLDPSQGRNSFRIVVHSRRAQDATSPKPRSWSHYFGAIAQLVLPIFAFWRTWR